MEIKEPLSEGEQEELFKNFKETQDTNIREKLILHNLRLVKWTMRRFHSPPNMSPDDLFQVGVMGLMKSIDKYNPDRGSFSNYAIFWIRHYILREINNFGKSIRVPIYLTEKILQLKQLKKSLFQELEREPTTKELSKEMNMDIESIEDMLNIIKEPISLNLPIGEDGEDLRMLDSISDSTLTPDLLVEDKIFIETFQYESKKALTELQYKFIIENYGVGSVIYTLEEIAERYNKTTNYIRSQINKGLRTLRKTRYCQEMLEERTIYIKSVDYTQPKVTGGLPSSKVEHIVIDREKILKQIKGEI